VSAFFVLEGDYELLLDGVWHKIPAGQAVLATRGGVHTFRNAGTTSGKMLVLVTPAGMEKYLEEISVLTMPQDTEQLMAISSRYGITFAR
jgi:quercetin dioxygenase-like cupin family protein